MKSKKLYLAITDGEEFEFYERSASGLKAMASLYNNETTRFFEVEIEREIELKYSVKPTNNGDIPNLNNSDEDEDIIE